MNQDLKKNYFDNKLFQIKIILIFFKCMLCGWFEMGCHLLVAGDAVFTRVEIVAVN